MIIIVAFFAMMAGFVLIFLLGLSDKKRKKITPDTKDQPNLLRQEFERACMSIIEGMKLEIRDAVRSGNGELDIIAENITPITGGKYLIQCHYMEEGRRMVDSREIMEFSNLVSQEKATKGILITNGQITPEYHTMIELAPMELVDEEKFFELSRKYAPDYSVMRL